jgi:hypothetical protein
LSGYSEAAELGEQKGIGLVVLKVFCLVVRKDDFAGESLDIQLAEVMVL